MRIKIYTREVHIHRMHKEKIYNHNGARLQGIACEVHAREVHRMIATRYTTHEIHALKVHAREVHVCETHARKVLPRSGASAG